MAADVFSHISAEGRQFVFNLVNELELKNILNDLFFDDVDL